jgi:transcriptional regulator with XRE-family HTH domain
MAKQVNERTQFVGAATPLERARDVNFGKRLKAILAKKELTASDVAAKIWDRQRNSKGALVARGRDRLSVWINGKSFPDRENLAKLAKALNVPVSELSPDAELQAANRATPEGSIVWSKDYPPGKTFLQLAQFVSLEAALEILAIIKRDEQKGEADAQTADPR